MIDLDNIEARIAEGIYGDDRMPRAARNDAFSALAEVIAEVERLRAEVADQQMLLDEHRLDNQHAYEEGGHAERASVVAWLRAAANKMWNDGHRGFSAVEDLADAIERGEHRREEDE